MLTQKILNFKTEALDKIAKAKDEKALYAVKVKYLGRKSGLLNEILKKMKELSQEDRKKIGPLANTVKAEIMKAYAAREKELAHAVDWEKERIDITVPGTKKSLGHLHPITIVQREIEDIFLSMGFGVADGPEIETEKYNFDVLNVPADHPARDMQDTFFLKGESGEEGKYVMRTHTSNVQVRFMEKHTPPFRVIVPGRTYRNEATDAKHEHTFYQFEAIVAGEDVNVGNFKYYGESFFSRFFKKDVHVRLRPSYFPFTEPSFEFDISCTVCGGKGCSTCAGSGWLEIGGAGMIHQNVFEAAGYPRNNYQGFAWGFGINRLAMMKYKINDIRLFNSGDLRFIKQF